MTFTPHFSNTDAITADLARIERARGFLEGAKFSDAWVRHMQGRALVREAHHTTHLEGTRLTLEQSEKLWAGGTVRDADPDDVQELLNYRGAFDLVAGYLGSGRPITEALVREIHKSLVKDVRGDKAEPGRYRKVQNYVVNSTTREITYTPPPPGDVAPMMRELVDWLGETKELSPIIEAGVAQFQFVHIHPFVDGNGRTARLLSTLCLYRSGYDFKRLFSISEFYDRDRPAYYEAIQSVRKNDMDMTGWLAYFVRGLATQMHDVQNKGERALRGDALVKKARAAGLDERALAVLEHLVGHDKATVSQLEGAIQANRRSIQRDLRYLVEMGYVIDVGGATDPGRHYIPKL